jgi:hypothetical protein
VTAPPPPRAPVLIHLELRGIVAGSASRWRLAGIEVWRGMDCLGTLSADAVRQLLEHHLATAALQASLAAELAPRLPAPPRAPRLLNPAHRTFLRQQRRTRT